MKKPKRPTNVRKLLRRLRWDLSLTQEALAAELEVSVWTVSGWETGKHTPSRMAWRGLQTFAKKHLGEVR